MTTETEGFIAVIGMAGRFPGAAGIDEFWRNLRDGVDSVTTVESPHGGSVGLGLLDDGDCFDAGFFGYTPAEALIIDPQHRVFLECAHQALEDAGYAARGYGGRIGVFGGGSATGYLNALHEHRDSLPFVHDAQLRIATSPDLLTTRTAHRLGLRGPAITIQTACSTSLVAIHLAVQSLLMGECDMALAGGAAVRFPSPSTIYSFDEAVSATARCRAFDAAADGFVGGSGAALVVLKPLDTALADGDHIHAVVRGSAVNNDGADKIGFTAPGLDGQVDVVHTAQVVAGVPADTVTYVEAHGSGTPLGDPIEVAALTKVFRATTDATGFCALGSVKTNIGHLDAAAGVAGFIKAVLAVEHGLLPPSLHHDTPNPRIDFASSPFVVNTALRHWEARPRRAGVTALGIGGTNAHVVLEQPPSRKPRPSSGPQLIVLSAKDIDALDTMTARFADRLEADPELDLADVAWTSQVGRQAHPVRRFAVCDDTADAARALRGGRLHTVGRATGRPVAFLFPGGGTQHAGMTAQLRGTPAFRDAFAEVNDLFTEELGVHPGEVDPTTATGFGTLIFAVEHALTRLWQDWGVRPDAVAGHSMGAYAAACAAGILSLEDAVRLVVVRGRLMDGLPQGAMLGVPLDEHELEPLLPQGVCVASVNGPGHATAAGAPDAVAELAENLAAQGVQTRPVRVPVASHSPLMDPILDDFEKAVGALTLRPATLPFVSDLTGEVVEETTPAYWRAHLRNTVRFGDVLATLLETEARVLLETGPGTGLTALARRHPALTADHHVVHSMPHPADDAGERAVLLAAAGRLWTAGVDLDWARLHDHRPRRVKLPGHPLRRKRFRMGANAGPVAAPERVVAPARIAGDGTEHRIAATFGAILGIEDVQPSDNFFGLGGDSLMATRLTSWLREEFHVVVTLREMFTSPTPARLATLVEAKGCQR